MLTAQLFADLSLSAALSHVPEEPFFLGDGTGYSWIAKQALRSIAEGWGFNLPARALQILKTGSTRAGIPFSHWKFWEAKCLGLRNEKIHNLYLIDLASIKLENWQTRTLKKTCRWMMLLYRLRVVSKKNWEVSHEKKFCSHDSGRLQIDYVDSVMTSKSAFLNYCHYWDSSVENQKM